MIDIFERFGLVRIINANGTATRLGASPMDAEVTLPWLRRRNPAWTWVNCQGRAWS